MISLKMPNIVERRERPKCVSVIWRECSVNCSTEYYCDLNKYFTYLNLRSVDLELYARIYFPVSTITSISLPSSSVRFKFLHELSIYNLFCNEHSKIL